MADHKNPIMNCPLYAPTVGIFVTVALAIIGGLVTGFAKNAEEHTSIFRALTDDQRVTTDKLARIETKLDLILKDKL